MSRDREARRRITALEARLEAVIKSIAEGQKAYEKRSAPMGSANEWAAVFAQSDRTRDELRAIEAKSQAFKRDLALAQEQASHESAAAASFAAVVGEWASRTAARAMEFEGRLRNPNSESTVPRPIELYKSKAASFAAVVGEWASRIAARAMEFEGRLRNPNSESTVPRPIELCKSNIAEMNARLDAAMSGVFGSSPESARQPEPSPDHQTASQQSLDPARESARPCPDGSQ